MWETPSVLVGLLRHVFLRKMPGHSILTVLFGNGTSWLLPPGPMKVVPFADVRRGLLVLGNNYTHEGQGCLV